MFLAVTVSSLKHHKHLLILENFLLQAAQRLVVVSDYILVALWHTNVKRLGMSNVFRRLSDQGRATSDAFFKSWELMMICWDVSFLAHSIDWCRLIGRSTGSSLLLIFFAIHKQVVQLLPNLHQAAVYSFSFRFGLRLWQVLFSMICDNSVLIFDQICIFSKLINCWLLNHPLTGSAMRRIRFLPRLLWVDLLYLSLVLWSFSLSHLRWGCMISKWWWWSCKWTWFTIRRLHTLILRNTLVLRLNLLDFSFQFGICLYQHDIIIFLVFQRFLYFFE